MLLLLLSGYPETGWPVRRHLPPPAALDDEDALMVLLAVLFRRHGGYR